MRHDPLEKDLLRGDRRALAKLISGVEARTDRSRNVLQAVYGRTGKIPVVGLTGPLGVGKSSIINRLIGHLRGMGKKVGVIAIDPSSPFSGGAVLGDRIRMEHPPGDPGIFVRSMATRGHAGGLAQGTRDTIRLMEAFGMDVVIVETVGSGQSDVDVRDIATTRIVVLVPHLGDDVQSLKAGLFEIADIFAVNKTDLPGSADAVRHLKEMATIMQPRNGWRTEVVECSAVNSTGIDSLWASIERHESFQRQSREAAAALRERLSKEVTELVQEKVESLLGGLVNRDGEMKGLLEDVVSGKVDPYTGSDVILERISRSGKVWKP
jgi:LAO/AO transport system kinase